MGYLQRLHNFIGSSCDCEVASSHESDVLLHHSSFSVHHDPEVWDGGLREPAADPSVWRDTFNDLLDSHLACDRSICPLMAYAMRFHTNLLLSSEVSFGGLRNKLLWKAVLADGGHLAQHHRGQFSGFGSGRYRPDVWLTAGATLDLLSLWPTLPHRSALK